MCICVYMDFYDHSCFNSLLVPFPYMNKGKYVQGF